MKKCLALLAGSLLGCGGGISAPTNVVVLPGDNSAGETDGKGAAVDQNIKYGSIEGRVVFAGTPPTLKNIYNAGAKIANPEICATEPIPNETLLVGKDNGVANVFIYLRKKPERGKLPPPTDKVVFDQRGCVFTPHAFIVQVGQPLELKNSDGTPHNSAFSGQNSFPDAIPPNASANIKLKFAEDSPVTVTCALHAWMSARCLPLDHPYAAVSKADGTFRIPKFPAGKHKLLIWHEAARGERFLDPVTVEVTEGKTTKITIEYNEKKLRPGLK